MRRAILIFALGLFVGPAPSQEIFFDEENANCLSEQDDAPLPMGGAWHVAGQPGRGFFFDIRACRILGYVLGYDREGNSLWLMFSGDLIRNTSSDDLDWSIETPLLEVLGPCDDCAYRPPMVDEVGTIDLDFESRTSALLSIDGAPPIRITTFEFGVNYFDVFLDGSLLVPELGLLWHVSVTSNFPANFEEVIESSVELAGGLSRDDDSISLGYRLGDESTIIGSLGCLWDATTQEHDGCRLRIPSQDIDLTFSIEDVSSNLIFVQGQSKTVVLRRVRFD